MGNIKHKSSQNGEKVHRGLRQIAKAASVSRPTIAKHLDEIDHRRLDGVVLVTQTALKRWLEGRNAEKTV